MSKTKCYRFFVLSKVIKDEVYVTYYVRDDLYPIYIGHHSSVGSVGSSKSNKVNKFLSFEEKDVVSSTRLPVPVPKFQQKTLNVLKMPFITVLKLPILINTLC